MIGGDAKTQWIRPPITYPLHCSRTVEAFPVETVESRCQRAPRASCRRRCHICCARKPDTPADSTAKHIPVRPRPSWVSPPCHFDDDIWGVRLESQGAARSGSGKSVLPGLPAKSLLAGIDGLDGALGGSEGLPQKRTPPSVCSHVKRAAFFVGADHAPLPFVFSPSASLANVFLTPPYPDYNGMSLCRKSACSIMTLEHMFESPGEEIA